MGLWMKLQMPLSVMELRFTRKPSECLWQSQELLEVLQDLEIASNVNKKVILQDNVQILVRKQKIKKENQMSVSNVKNKVICQENVLVLKLVMKPWSHKTSQHKIQNFLWLILHHKSLMRN